MAHLCYQVTKGMNIITPIRDLVLRTLSTRLQSRHLIQAKTCVTPQFSVLRVIYYAVEAAYYLIFTLIEVNNVMTESIVLAYTRD